MQKKHNFYSLLPQLQKGPKKDVAWRQRLGSFVQEHAKAFVRPDETAVTWELDAVMEQIGYALADPNFAPEDARDTDEYCVDEKLDIYQGPIQLGTAKALVVGIESQMLSGVNWLTSAHSLHAGAYIYCADDPTIFYAGRPVRNYVVELRIFRLASEQGVLRSVWSKTPKVSLEIRFDSVQPQDTLMRIAFSVPTGHATQVSTQMATVRDHLANSKPYDTFIDHEYSVAVQVRMLAFIEASDLSDENKVT